MAYKGKKISNPVIGQEIRFIKTSKDTDGQLLEMEASYRAGSREPPPHFHPHQEEHFTVQSGEMTVRLEGEAPRVLKQGDQLQIRRNQLHSMWNGGNQPALVNWQVRPAMTTEYLLETVTGLAADGKTNAQGVPGILQIAMTVSKFSPVMRLTTPPLAVQRIVFGVLKPIAWMIGYRATYKKYLD